MLADAIIRAAGFLLLLLMLKVAARMFGQRFGFYDPEPSEWRQWLDQSNAERDSARNVAVRLEQELAELRRQYGLDS